MKAATVRFEPRKTPVQARSTASVEAIMQAAIQVLLKEGKSKLTTTRVAQRAGVSVGTLYQYFPNKSSLLQAVMKEHMDQVAVAVEEACASVHGESLAKIADAITSGFLKAKFRDVNVSRALYAVSEDLEGKKIVREMHLRSRTAMADVFLTAKGVTVAEADVVASTLLSAMAGVSRAMLESDMLPTSMPAMEKELATLARAYLEAAVSAR